MTNLEREFFEHSQKYYRTDIEIQILAMAKHIRSCNWLEHSVGKPIENRSIKIPYKRLFYVSY